MIAATSIVNVWSYGGHTPQARFFDRASGERMGCIPGKSLSGMSSKSAPRPPCWPGTTRTVPAGGRGEGRRRQRGARPNQAPCRRHTRKIRNARVPR
ncbi:hypothetical protein D558_1762 [Bordetella holmesii 44057]|nr:hypothetical protein D560_1771 [Bordetella holmesii ATCC 51541]AIT26433.1 hypothetical protein D558_1762 [Bordetella holmesii 44057]